MENTSIVEENLYCDLPPSVINNASKLGLQLAVTSKKDTIRGFLRRHLPVNRLLKGEDDIGRSQVPLSNPLASVRKKFNLTRPKRKKLLNKERKKNKVFKIPKQDQSFAQQLVLHQAWTQYMEELIPSSSLSSPGAVNAACQKVIKAELQGAMLTVQCSKCPSYVGTTGIVMQETRHTFTIITCDNTVKCIPKKNSIFALQHCGHLFTIHGNHFLIKAGERSSKKFKSKATVDL